jgi:hypothetical protein
MCPKVSGHQWRQQQREHQRVRGTEITQTRWHAPPTRKVTFTFTETVYYKEHCQIVYWKVPVISGKEWRIKHFHPKPGRMWERDETVCYDQKAANQ